MSRRWVGQRTGPLSIMLAVLLVLAACGENGDGAEPGDDEPVDDEPISVGIMVPLSGVYAPLGEDMVEAFELYVDENDGMLGGREVEIVTAETEADPEVGLRAAQRLVLEDEVDFVTGIVSSAVALGVRDLFDEAEVPLIISNAGANGVTGDARSPYIFRTSFSNWQTSVSLGEWAYENVAQENFYVTAPDYAAGDEDIEAFRESFEEAGGEVIEGERPGFGTTQDYQPFLADIRNSGAEAVFAFFAGSEAVTFVQQYDEFGLADEIPLIGPGFLTASDALPAQGESAEGIRTSLHYSSQLDNPANEEFVANYTDVAGREPSVYAVQSYDAAAVIDSALDSLGGDISDPEAVIEALANVGTIDSPRGEWEMDPETHNPIQTFYLLEVQEQDGEFVNAVVDDLGEYTDPGE